MFEIYSFCRKVDDIADAAGPRDSALDQLKLWRADIDALYTGSAVSRAREPRRAGQGVRPAARGFPGRDRRHGDGRRRRHPRAGLGDARCLLRPRRERGRAALACACSAWRRRPGIVARLSSRPRAAAHQHPARHRRGCRRSGGSICRARRCSRPASSSTDPAAVLAHPRLGQACAQVVARAREHFAEADRIMDKCARKTVRAPRIMGAPTRRSSSELVARGWAAPRAAGESLEAAPAPRPSCATRSSDAAHGPRHRRRARRPCRRGPPRRSAASASSCTRRQGRRADAAAPTTIRSSA